MLFTDYNIEDAKEVAREDERIKIFNNLVKHGMSPEEAAECIGHRLLRR